LEIHVRILEIGTRPRRPTGAHEYWFATQAPSQGSRQESLPILAVGGAGLSPALPVALEPLHGKQLQCFDLDDRIIWMVTNTIVHWVRSLRTKLIKLVLPLPHFYS